MTRNIQTMRKVPLPRRVLRVAMVQNAAGPDVSANLHRIRELADAVSDGNSRHCRPSDCDLWVLPEVFAVRGAPADYRAAAEKIPGPLCAWASDWARRRRAWVLAGSLIERAGGRFYNTSVLFNRRGVLVARYRKIHLFAAKLADGSVVREHDVYAPGASPVIARIDGWLCGMAICYDLRFPELFRRYADAGVHLMFAPANFTHATGRAHWELLVRARAVENQAFMVAPNQCGVNAADGVAAYGHSLAVDPWGGVMADGGTGEGVVCATLDPALLKDARRRLPALTHRRRIPCCS